VAISKILRIFYVNIKLPVFFIFFKMIFIKTNESLNTIQYNTNYLSTSSDKRYYSILMAFIIWLAPRAGKMTQIARCDWLLERARWSHLARSGLPAVSCKKNFPESPIINPLLTKFVRSRWLDIGLVLFLRVYGPRLRLGP